MKKPLLFITSCVLASTFAVNRANAQSADTSKHVFQLGQVSIAGTKDTLISNSLGASTINLYNRTDVSHALSLLPGVTLTGVGARNESAINVRGFDIRQVPVYLDGVPLYVPYDGYVDLARYNTFNLSQINVSKGYSSILFGPNTEGGAINLVSRKPVNPFELNAVAGYMSGGYRLNTNIGSKQGDFYYEVSASQLKRNYYPLSSSFTPVKNEDGGHRDNSYSSDMDISGKVGFTPSKNQEYAIGYSYHHGTKGTPVYVGMDPQNMLFKNPRYWKWPNWDTQGLYLLSNNKLNSTNVIKTRWYYDQFKNETDSYDDATYSTITKGYAFKSIYNDYTLGGSVIFENTDLKNNNFSVIGQYKQDVHREHNIGEPIRRDADNNFYAGLEDTYHITSALKVNAGISYNDRRSTETQQYIKNVVSNLPDNSNSAWNVQGLVQYDFDSNNSLDFSVAKKTRFPTIKDRYSSKFGTSVPNPDLKTEGSLNYDLTYHSLIADKLSLEVSGFYSNINNTILTVANVAVDPVSHNSLTQVQNVGKSEFYGGELAAGYAFAPQFRVDANYTLTVRTNLTPMRYSFTDVPKHKVFASIQYSPITKLYVLASEEYNSDRFSTTYGTVSGAFYLSNVKVHLNLPKGFAIEGGVNNLFDRNYTLVEGYPEEGRNYFANLIFNY